MTPKSSPLLILLITFQAFACCATAKDALIEGAGERQLGLSGTHNTRDLGGYRTTENKKVKWGMLFRSDRLSALTKEDLKTIQALSLSTVTDFRSTAERDSHPNRLPQQSPAINYQLLPMANPALDVVALGGKIYSGNLTNAELLSVVEMREEVNSAQFRERWGKWIRSLAEPDALPQLFHCTAGKDRTGMGAALILLTLGVPKDKAIEDFLLSNHYLAARINQSVLTIQELSESLLDEMHLRSLVGVSPKTLPIAFNEMEKKYGSIDHYIEDGLGIDPLTRDKLKSLLLE